MIKRAKSILISSLLLCFILIFISKTIGFQKIYTLVGDFPKGELIGLLGVSFLLLVTRTWRFHILLKRNNIKITFLQSLKVFIASGATTPFPGGEFGRGILLKKETGARMVEGAAAILLQAIGELLAASVTLLFLSVFFPSLFGPALTTTIALTALLFIYTHNKIFSFISKQLSRWKYFKKKESDFLSIHKGMRLSLLQKQKDLPGKTFIKTIFIGCLTQIIGGLLIYFISAHFNVKITILEATAVFAASVLIQGIAGFVPGGFGFTEGGMTGLLYLFKVPVEEGIAIVLIFRVITLFFSILLGLIVTGVFYRDHLFAKHER